MKTARIHRAASLRGRRGVIVLVGAIALLTAALSSCGARTGSSAEGPPSSQSPISQTVAPSRRNSPTPSVTPASWRRITPAPIDFDYFTPAAAVWDGDEMLLVVTRSGPRATCDETVLAYDPSTDSWRALSSVPKPKGCFEGSELAVWTGHELLLSGISNTAYDPATGTWRHLPGYGLGGGTPFAVWTGKQMIGWGGGCCDQELADGAAYTLATNTWKVLPPSPLAGRHAAGAWTGKELIIAGGSGYSPPPTEPAWRFVHFADAAAYDPAAHEWRTLPPMPVVRGGDYDTVWDGSELLVIGGTSGTSMSAALLARGVAYVPSSNSWRWMAPIGFPRTGFVSAWTGRRLVVWGGAGAEGAVPPHGEMYDPSTDTWSAMPKAPLRARTDAVAVWTGTEWIVWGGADARTGNRLVDGAVFTPASG